MIKRKNTTEISSETQYFICAEPGRSIAEVAENFVIVHRMYYIVGAGNYHMSNDKQVFPGNGVEALTEEQNGFGNLKTASRNTDERDKLKKQWPFSTKLRNEISIYRKSSLQVYDEDVPSP